MNIRMDKFSSFLATPPPTPSKTCPTQEASNEECSSGNALAYPGFQLKVWRSEFCHRVKLTFVHVPFLCSLLGSVFIVLTPRVSSNNRLPVVTGERELQFSTFIELWWLPDAAYWRDETSPCSKAEATSNRVPRIQEESHHVGTQRRALPHQEVGGCICALSVSFSSSTPALVVASGLLWWWEMSLGMACAVMNWLITYISLCQNLLLQCVLETSIACSRDVSSVILQEKFPKILGVRLICILPWDPTEV